MTDNINKIENKVLEAEENHEAVSQIEPPQEEERSVVFEEALEAILFAAGHPISYAALGRVFDITPAKVKDKVFEYSVKYNDPNIPRGVVLLTYPDTCQLCTKQNYLPEIREALGIRKSGSLSTSSMEALAIIAYNQPVTRVFVDTLRRADSSYAMGNLLDRGLIESKGRLDAPGRPMLYGTTHDFLRCFGLESLSSLPKTSEELMEVFSNAKLAEAKEAEDALNESDTSGDENSLQISMDLDAPTTDEAYNDAIDEPSAEDDVALEF